ncbi:MAG: transposase, partial [Bacilli bacterium]|nr:transposase [Bacilli bacterium]
MNDNAFLMAFGMKPENFERTEGPLTSDDGIIYEGWEARKSGLKCPACRSGAYIIHNRYIANIRLRSNILKTEILICHRIRYVCKDCGKTFTMPLLGAMVGRGLTYEERATMLAELNGGDTFAKVSERHGVSKTEAVRMFDEAYPEVIRKPLPKILLIDEFKFHSRFSKYACHLVDFEKSNTVDVIRSRQKAYLDEYFGAIGQNERDRVKALVTDMYDEYAHLSKRWLAHSKVIVDRFHVVKQLTEAVNKLRVIAMSKNEKDTLAYNFMKSHWRLFLMRKAYVPDKFYTRKSDGLAMHYDDLLRYCLLKDTDLRNGYDCLQDLYRYMRTEDLFSTAVANIEFIAQKLANCQCPILTKVSDTYIKWKIEIARGLAKNEFGMVLTNAKMEASNNVAQTLI